MTEILIFLQKHYDLVIFCLVMAGVGQAIDVFGHRYFDRLAEDEHMKSGHASLDSVIVEGEKPQARKDLSQMQQDIQRLRTEVATFEGRRLRRSTHSTIRTKSLASSSSAYVGALRHKRTRIAWTNV
jgi:hypothetical protein